MTSITGPLKIMDIPKEQLTIEHIVQNPVACGYLLRFCEESVRIKKIVVGSILTSNFFSFVQRIYIFGLPLMNLKIIVQHWNSKKVRMI